LKVVSSGRDQAGARARLDRHVADGHAAFHRHLADGAAGILDHVAGAAGGAELADDGQDHVLGRDAERQAAFDQHAHVLGRLLDQRLGGEHVLDLRGADAEGQRAERAVRRGVAVAADDGHARQGQALLRADHVHDAAAGVVHVEIGHAEIGDVLLERLDLDARFLIHAALADRRGRRVVVGDGDGGVGPAHGAAGHAQAFEGLRAGHLVDEVTVDVDHAGAVVLAMDDVVVPDLLEQGARRRRRAAARPTSCGTPWCAYFLAAPLAARRSSSSSGLFLLELLAPGPLGGLLGLLGEQLALGLDVLGDAARLAAQVAQVIELGAAHGALADHLDLPDARP
jgi:hypothetical protein